MALGQHSHSKTQQDAAESTLTEKVWAAQGRAEQGRAGQGRAGQYADVHSCIHVRQEAAGLDSGQGGKARQGTIEK